MHLHQIWVRSISLYACYELINLSDVHEVKASTEAPSQPDGVSYEAPPQPSSIATLEISTSNVITAPDASRSQARMPGVDTSITQVSDEKNGVDAPGPVMDPRIPSHLSAKDC
jgi:hypothetical protein